jgi:hypothetical protein
MAPEATLPPGDVNVPGDYFSLAGFEVNLYGRFWLTPEAQTDALQKASNVPIRYCLKSTSLRVGQAAIQIT